MAEEKKVLSVYLPEGITTRIKAISVEENRSFNNQLNVLLLEALEDRTTKITTNNTNKGE